jgi:hypothetical protein
MLAFFADWLVSQPAVVQLLSLHWSVFVKWPAGPRAWTFAEGERRAAMEAMLDVADCVVMTEEEAEAVTGLRGAEAQARFVLGRPGSRTEWCIVKRGAEGAVLAARDGPVVEQRALQVDVRDTGEHQFGGCWACSQQPCRCWRAQACLLHMAGYS